MKKIIAFLLCGILLLSVLPFAASAQNSLTLTADSVSGKAGETVTATISVSSNPGIAYLKLAINVGSAPVEWISATNLATDMVMTKGVGLISWDNSEDYTQTGTFCTLSFEISDSATAGSYSITVSCAECYNENLDDIAVNSIEIQIEVEADDSQITSASLALGTDVTVNYYATLSAAQADAQIRFTMNGKETIVDGTQEGTEYVFPFGVSPQCMGDNIKAELILGEEVLDTVESYSVRQNCLNLLAQNPSDELRTLIADLLEYGAMSQVYTNYKTDELVNEGITGKTEFVPLADDEANDLYVTYELNESSNEAYYLTAAGVYFDSVNRLYFKLHAENVTDSNFEVVITDMQGNKVSRLPSEFEEIGENLYMVYTDPIYASELSFSEEDGDYYWYNVSLNTVQIKKGKRVLTAVQNLDYYSLASYVYKKQYDNSAMSDLAKAIYNYGLSAAAYLDAQ